MNQAAIQFEKNIPATEINYQVVTDDFSNETLRNNLIYFREHHPDIYTLIKDHKCTDYRLAINPDGSPNIMHMPSRSLVYYSDGSMNMNSTRARLEKIPFKFDIDPAYVMQMPEAWYEKSPLTSNFYQKLYEAGPIKLMSDAEKLKTFNDTYNTGFISFLRVYGIGLGFHIQHLVETRDVQTLIIYEPELDLFYTSLFTTPWWLIFSYKELDKSRIIKLMVGISPETAIEQEKQLLHENSRVFITATRWQLSLFETPAIKQFIELENQTYQAFAEGLTAGWYEDQKKGLIDNIDNLKQHRKVYNGKKPDKFLRMALVGAGPSLDKSIEVLKKHRDDFIVCACGTAITPLIKENIIPDFHVLIERNLNYETMMDLSAGKGYEGISSIKLNVVEPGLDNLYDDTLVIQKYNDPASALLDNSFPLTKNVNPTVTNCAIAIACELNASEVYLFGIDYGTPAGHDRMHANNYFYEHHERNQVNQNGLKLVGNFGQEIITTGKLMLSHLFAEESIQNKPQIKWFNVGDGVIIKGTTPIKALDVDELIHNNFNRAELSSMIKSCFTNRYTTTSIHKNICSHINTIEEYFEALNRFLSQNQVHSRSEIFSILSELYAAANTGNSESHFMPHKLFSGCLRHYVSNTATQVCMLEDDRQAIEYFDQSVLILKQFLDQVRDDAVGVLSESKQLFGQDYK